MTDSIHGLPVAANLLNRQFEMIGPNQGWLYLAVILDLFLWYEPTGRQLQQCRCRDLTLDGPGLTPELAYARVADNIDHFYNPGRKHSTRDYFSPIE